MMHFLLFSFFALNASANVGSVYSTRDNNFIAYEDFINKINRSEFIVMGEYHNDEKIQLAQAQIIADTTVSSGHEKNLSVMWEFLNFTDQEKIDLEYARLLKDEITPIEFVSKTSHPGNKTYAPIFEVAKDLGAKVWGLNLPREYKQKVIKEGIQSIDPSLIPPSHYVGGKEYSERFLESMGGHVPAEKVASYFLAQCLTDSVMAHHAALHHGSLSFIIAGSFHTDFYDATVIRLKKLTNKPIATLKIVNEDNLNETDRAELLGGSSKYGAYADYIVFAR